MSVILFIDLLGARRQWQEGGVDGATYAFKQFSEMVVAALREEDPSTVQIAGIETDSAMLMFESASPALRTAQRLYARAFLTRTNPISERIWLRGSLVPCDSKYLRRKSPMAAPFESVSVHKYSSAALEAISIEKSGFKGMRLLVHKEVIDSATRSELWLEIGDSRVLTVRRLKHSFCPKIQAGTLLDYLWMATSDLTERRRFDQRMSLRLRQAANDPAEFAQAAATQVLFHEYNALLES